MKVKCIHCKKILFDDGKVGKITNVLKVLCTECCSTVLEILIDTLEEEE